MNAFKKILTNQNVTATKCIKATSFTTKRGISSTLVCKHMSHNKTCWQCQATNNPTALFCENKVCSVIQPIPSELNFFQLMEAGKGEKKINIQYRSESPEKKVFDTSTKSAP
ncbi:hypothetical protein BY458DRAFT_68222 [Sporodiniella umbellata]|nr:hypothetical protein BY458DRAFT_68222 [Sporodiniella umbellata]